QCNGPTRSDRSCHLSQRRSDLRCHGRSNRRRQTRIHPWCSRLHRRNLLRGPPALLRGPPDRPSDREMAAASPAAYGREAGPCVALAGTTRRGCSVSAPLHSRPAAPHVFGGGTTPDPLLDVLTLFPSGSDSLDAAPRRRGRDRRQEPAAPRTPRACDSPGGCAGTEARDRLAGAAAVHWPRAADAAMGILAAGAGPYPGRLLHPLSPTPPPRPSPP